MFQASILKVSTARLMYRCDGGPDATVKFCDSEKTEGLDTNSARTLTGPGIVPEKTETDASPVALVVAVVDATDPDAPSPTPPGLTEILNRTGTFGIGVPAEERTMNLAMDCSTAPDPATKICDGVADKKVTALATGAATLTVVLWGAAPGLDAEMVTGPLHS